MKKNLKYMMDYCTTNMLRLALPIFTISILASCEDMNSIHEKYYEEGEDIYTGVVDSLKSFSGYEKIRFEWEINADPRITKTVIYWNQRTDSTIINVNRTQAGRLQLSHDMDNVEEGTYVFEFITRDDLGHFSLPTEIVAEAYGDFFLQSLRNRSVVSISKLADGSMRIAWDGIASNTVQYTTVLYDEGGVEKSVRVENDDTETILNSLKTGDTIRVFTTHLPENALETLDAPIQEYVMP